MYPVSSFCLDCFLSFLKLHAYWPALFTDGPYCRATGWPASIFLGDPPVITIALFLRRSSLSALGYQFLQAFWSWTGQEKPLLAHSSMYRLLFNPPDIFQYFYSIIHCMLWVWGPDCLCLLHRLSTDSLASSSQPDSHLWQNLGGSNFPMFYRAGT